MLSLLFGLIGYGGWHGNIDQSTLWLAQGIVMKYLGIAGYVLVIISMLAIPWLQFMKAKDKQKYYDGIVEELIMKVLAVCGSGMGTSMIMKMKMKKVLDKLGIQASVNSCSRVKLKLILMVMML